jgi:hypothetical protein
MNLHLFFDVYIEDAPLGTYLRGDRKRFDIDFQIRTATPTYAFQSKYDITRYTLDSYAEIPWSSATIRIECENPSHRNIYSELRKKFPTGSIKDNRSDSTEKYFNSLSKLDLPDDSWIFFSPNNDHPFYGDHKKLAAVLADADDATKRTQADIVSIPYSHFTECMNMFSPFHHEWGAYGGVFPKLLYETKNSYIIKTNKLLLDSLHIYRLNDLKWIFGASKNTGRVIRPEDTEFYLSEIKSHVMVIPKFEFCRHYDGYSHITEKVPPLFIPKGYFEKNIRIRYGYNDIKADYVNINPSSNYFSFQNSSGSDLKIIMEDIPNFWKKRISEIDINPSYITPPSNKIAYYFDLKNPWRETSKHINLIRSIIKKLKYKIKKINFHQR